MGGGPTTTTKTTVDQPAWLQSDWKNLAGQAMSQGSNAIAQGAPQQGIATESAGIVNSANASNGLVQSQLPQIQSDIAGANKTLAGIAGSQWNNEAVQQYMDPYTKNVLTAQHQLADQNLAQELSGINSSAAASGALGGSRSAVLSSNVLNDANLQRNAMDANALQAAYQTGQNQFNADRSTNLSSALAVGQNDATLASTEGNMLGTASNLGQVDQNARQTALNTDYQNALQRILFPEQQTQYQAGLLNAVNPNFTGSTQTQKQSGGVLQGILGAAAGIGGGILTGGLTNMMGMGRK